ncbi:hypothetical protein [Streptomyces sp. NBC_00102]|uniref:hypothetical protein n=1 Tax=Streptomyces sp. NBC_00102 TaxID=2975652 RepID=UPI00225A1516|nr:hypothetical protein [Streptomyces sp. NBC_00102]MCX5396878.1 hypothetical protein [Streptomyces sp. NBC_00102]
MSITAPITVLAEVAPEVTPDWELSVISFGQKAAEALGIPLHLTTMEPDTAFGVVVLPLILVALVVGTQAGAIVRALVSRDFWRDGTRLMAVIQFALLILAYAFSAGPRSRSSAEAAGHVLSGQLPDILPLAIMTQWGLLTALWILFGVLTGIGRSALLVPFETVGAMPVLGLFLVIFTAAWMAPPVGDGVLGHAPAAVAVTVMILLLGYFTAANRERVLSSPAALARRAELFQDAARRSPDDIVIAAFSADAQRATPRRPRSGGPWVPAPSMVLRLSALWAALLGGPAAVITFVFVAGPFEPPEFVTVARVELLVLAVFQVVLLFSFRRSLDDRARVSPVVPRLIDLSLILSAGLLAATEAARTPVALGGVPAWLLMGAPALVVAGLVFVFGVLPHRFAARRWGTAVVAALVAAVLVLPLKSGLELVLEPVIRMLAP